MVVFSDAHYSLKEYHKKRETARMCRFSSALNIIIITLRNRRNQGVLFCLPANVRSPLLNLRLYG